MLFWTSLTFIMNNNSSSKYFILSYDIPRVVIMLISRLFLPLNISLYFLTAPVFYFGELEYHVDESDGYVEVRVWRTGSDLSKTGTVTVRSRKTDPVSAEGMYQTDTCMAFLCADAFIYNYCQHVRLK